jgi:hypothetical protein
VPIQNVIQDSSLLTMALLMLVLFLSQRFFMLGEIVTWIE